MSELLIYSIGLGLAFYVAWCLGANDAANPTSCSVGTGAISLRRALLLFAGFTVLGAVLMGHMVMKTINSGIVYELTVLGAFTTILAVCIWVTFCSWRGMPISTTHSIVGAVIGYGIVTGLWASEAPFVVLLIVIGMVASPFVALFLAMGLHSGFKGHFSKMAEKVSPEKVERLMKRMLIAALCLMAFTFGANDVANATGVFVTATSKLGEVPSGTAMVLLALLAAAGILLGAFMLGSRVIETSGRRITRLDYTMGAAAEWSNMIVIFLFMTIPFIIWGWGLPLSTTHASIGAIVGVGLVRGGAGVNRKIVKRIVASWLVTFPATALLSICLYEIFSIFIVV